MDANTLSLLQQQHIQQLQQLSLYQYPNLNPMFVSQENQTFQLLTELIQLKHSQSHLNMDHLRPELPNPYATKFAGSLHQRHASLGVLKSHDFSQNDGFQVGPVYTELMNRLVRTASQTQVDHTDSQSLAVVAKLAQQLIQLNSRSCTSFTSPSISPESNRSGQLSGGDNSSPTNPLNMMKCASTPKQVSVPPSSSSCLDIRDRLQALERLNDIFNPNKQHLQQHPVNDDLSSGPLFDNTQFTPLQSSLEESGCIDLSYTGTQKIRSTPNELFVNFSPLDNYPVKQIQSATESKSINASNDLMQTSGDALANLYDNIKKSSSPPTMTLPLTTIPLNFDSTELFSSLLRMKTPCKSPSQNEPLKEDEADNTQDLPPLSVHSTPNSTSTTTTHHGRTKNRKSGFQAGVTVGYTYDAFFISDGRSRKRASNRNQLKPTHRARHSSTILSPNSQSGLSQSSNSSVDGSSLSTTTTNRPITPALSSHLSLASTLSPPQETSVQRYSCPDCGKNYATSSNLSRHKQTHRSLDSQSARKCPQCGKAYVSMPALSMHMLTHDLKHRCDICGKAFSRPWLLQGHRRAHTGEKPYGCAHCGRAFADRSNLRAHMQTHSGMKHFECKQCHKNFALKSYLNKHLESGCLNKSSSTDSVQIPNFQPMSSVIHLEDPVKHQSKPNTSLSWSVTDLIS